MHIEIEINEGKKVIENVIDFYRSPSAIRVISLEDNCQVDEIYSDGV